MQNNNPNNILQCIDYIYQTIDDPLQWQAVLHFLSRYVHNGKATISSRSNSNGHVDISDSTHTKSYGFSKKCIKRYFELTKDNSGLFTPWIDIEQRHSLGQLCIFHEHLPLASLKQTKLYTEWLAPPKI